MALAAGRGRGREPRPRWAAPGFSPLGRGPSPLKPFVAAGCSFLLPSFSAFSLSPDRKPLATPPTSGNPPPHPAGLRNRGALEGTLGGQSCGRGSWEGAGVSGSPPA